MFIRSTVRSFIHSRLGKGPLAGAGFLFQVLFLSSSFLSSFPFCPGGILSRPFLSALRSLRTTAVVQGGNNV